MKGKHSFLLLLLCIPWLTYFAVEDTDHQQDVTMQPHIHIATLGVSDLNRSFQFYRDGLGFPTSMTPERGIVFFATSGVRFALYPYDKLAEDAELHVSSDGKERPVFPGFTLAHCARSREDVDRILQEVEAAGGTIVKKARDTFWGGYSGYFSDPDGYLWEVAYFDQWKFNPDGSLVME